MNFLKSSSKTAVDEAKKIAKQVAREPYEIIKNVVPSAVGEGGMKGEKQKTALSKIVEGGENLSLGSIDEEALKAQTNRRLKELEEEIRKIREERKMREEEWRKQQEEVMKVEEPQEQPFIEPPSRKKRGFLGFVKKKQGTKEMGKQISG